MTLGALSTVVVSGAVVAGLAVRVSGVVENHAYPRARVVTL